MSNAGREQKPRFHVPVFTKQNTSLYPRYFGLRRVNPYRGVVQVVEAGCAGGGLATAHSFDGQTWHLRADDGNGLMRPVGVWETDAGFKLGQPEAAADLIAALQTPPPLPFSLFDTWELWLLDLEQGLPLALIDTARDNGEPRQVHAQPEWYPFVSTFTGFHSPALAEVLSAQGLTAQEINASHRDWLARTVNGRARPHPKAQWFKRDQQGAGQGAEGTRLPYEWRHRRLPAEAFPPLLVGASGNSRLEQSVIDDYHAALAPALLQWPRLSTELRNTLEAQACEQPDGLVRVHRLLPRVVDPGRLNAALVAARLMAAQGDPIRPPPWQYS